MEQWITKALELGFDAAAPLDTATLLAREDIRDDYLRLYVTDQYAGLELVGQLREKFPHLLEVYGKSLTEEGELSVLTVEELEEMKEEDIMIRFLAENFSAEPTCEQLQLFRDVLEWSREEGTLA